MTACRNKASRAVTAALVGVLSVGAVPMVALAQTGAAPMASVDPDQAFSNGTVTLVSYPTESDGSYKVPYSGIAHKPDVAKVEFGGITLSDVSSSNDYLVYYVKANDKGELGTEKVSAMVDAGTYYVVVEAVSGDYAGGKTAVKFVVTGTDLSAATVTATDGSDTTVVSDNGHVTYDAEAVDFAFKAGSDELVEGVDYTVKYYKSGESYTNSAAGSETAPTDAGTYYARLTGAGSYTGSKNFTFTIDKFDLRNASSDVKDAYVATVIGEDAEMPTAPTTVNGSEALASKLALKYGSTVVGDCRAYSPVLVTVAENDPNFITGANPVNDNVSVSFDKVKKPVTFTYDGEAMPTSVTVNASKDESFDLSEVKATYVDADGKEQPVNQDTNTVSPAAGTWIVTATDEDGKNATQAWADFNAEVPGTYVLTFKAVADSGYNYGGSVQVKVTIISGAVDCADSMYVSYEGKIVSSIEKDYDGEDLMAPTSTLNVVLKDGDKTLAPGTDYEVVFKDAEGNEVKSVEDAGKYVMEVKGLAYQVENGTFDITINKADVQAIRILVDGVDDNVDGATGETLKAIDGQYAIPYTGNAMSPRFVYTTGERDADGELVWHWLYKTGDKVAAATDLSYTKDGKDVNVVKEAGDYVATLTLLGTDEAKNFELSAKPYEFSVVDKVGTFVDVPADAYYFGSIEQAYKNHYIYGYNNGAIFGPTDSMSRADVAVVLYRMSGSQIDNNNEGAYDETTGWNTGYVDVDGKAYYAEAVAWARKAGVVAGLDSEHFGPTQKVTREQFATMLANYAKARGDFEAADESVLDRYGDADQVSSFARGTVAWAVEEGVMGGSANLMPTNEVTRADVAVMAVNYQPAPMVVKPVA